MSTFCGSPLGSSFLPLSTAWDCILLRLRHACWVCSSDHERTEHQINTLLITTWAFEASETCSSGGHYLFIKRCWTI
eukprot:5005921-Amphidinium_carterae.1